MWAGIIGLVVMWSLLYLEVRFFRYLDNRKDEQS